MERNWLLIWPAKPALMQDDRRRRLVVERADALQIGHHIIVQRLLPRAGGIEAVDQRIDDEGGVPGDAVAICGDWVVVPATGKR